MQGIEALKPTADILAEFGRNGDIYIVHAAEGETVVPMEVFESNPALKRMLWAQMRDMGIDPDRYVVGNELNSRNPITGQPEFFLKKLWNKIKPILKTAAPLIGAIAGAFIPGVGPIIGPAIGAFIGGKLGGYSTKQSLIGAGLAGLGGYMLGGTAAAAAGYAGGAGSLGSALFQGAGQTGIGGLMAAAPKASLAAASAPGMVAPQAISGAGSPAVFASPAAAAAAPAGGGVFSGIGSWLGKNPGLALAGGAAVLSLLDKEKKPKPSKHWDDRTGRKLIDENPGKYDFGGDNQYFGDTSMVNAQYAGPSYQEQYGMAGPPVFTPGPYQMPPGYVAPYIEPYQPLNAAKGGHIRGPGTGTSDSIPAYLSDGEFVMTAKAVLGAGKGDRMKGANKMYKVMREYEKLNA